MLTFLELAHTLDATQLCLSCHCTHAGCDALCLRTRSLKSMRDRLFTLLVSYTPVITSSLHGIRVFFIMVSPNEVSGCLLEPIMKEGVIYETTLKYLGSQSGQSVRFAVGLRCDFLDCEFRGSAAQCTAP